MDIIPQSCLREWPEFPVAVHNRSMALLQAQEWEKAKSDLMIARNMGVNIIALFQNYYASVDDFEQKHGVKLPEDIAAMLTPL